MSSLLARARLPLRSTRCCAGPFFHRQRGAPGENPDSCDGVETPWGAGHRDDLANYIELPIPIERAARDSREVQAMASFR
jgi:hypothetical protein